MIRLEPGDTAPDFTLTADDESTICLADLAGRRVILYVFPAAMTPGCTTQAEDFRDTYEAFTEAGFTILGLSPDPPERLAQFVEQEAVPFRMLSDQDKTVMGEYGAFGEKTMYGKKVTGVIRSTFVIDDGRIELAKYNVRATGHVASLAKTLGVALPA